MAARPRVGLVVGLVVAGLVLFVVPSAWLHARGVPWFLCALGGALVFPLLPLGWHLLGERSRRAAAAAAKGPAKASLTGVDRFVLRLGVVALAVMGPLLFFRAGQTWRAVRDHGTWFIPRAPAPPRSLKGDPRVLAQVPADAELVMWARSFDALSAGDDEGPARRDRDAAPQPEEVLIAMRGRAVMMVVRGPARALADLDVAEANKQLAKQTLLPLDGPLVVRSRGEDLMVVVSEGWAQDADDRAAGVGGGPTTILERLEGAPRDAVVIAAAAPSREIAGLSLTGAQAWVRASKNDIRIDGELFVADRAASVAVVTAMRAAMGDARAQLPGDCKKPVGRLLDKVVIDGGETSVRVSAHWAPRELGEAAMCALAIAMKQAK